MAVIKVDNFTKNYGHNRGAFNVFFEIKKGEVFGFLGPNGAGKSTTIRHLLGFSKPDEGSTYINGLESFQNYDKFLKSVGYVPGEVSLPAGLTCKEFVEMMMKLKNCENRKWLDHLLGLFKVSLNGTTKKLSLGEKRKLAIVAAFVNDPDIIILDEPTSGLDPVMQEVFIDFIKNEKKRGKTILLSSHIFNEVCETCDRISIIKQGRIVSTINASLIKHNKNKRYEIVFKDASNMQSFIEKNTACRIVSQNVLKKKIIVNCLDSKINGLISLISGFEIESFKEIKTTLEGYFMKFYKNETSFRGEL